jgi:hypothetical protein
MKTIRLIAGSLITVDGVLHLIEYLKSSDSPGSKGLLVFGIIYILTGLLLFGKKRYPVYLGIVIPVIGMTLSIIKFGIPELISMSALFKVLGIIVFLCCFYILIKQKQN